MLWLKRPFNALSPNQCILCKGSSEMIDHLFLHYQITLSLWHRIFSQAGMEWVQPGRIRNMIVISFKCFRNSNKGKTLQKITCFSLLWIVCRERNARIFKNTWRTSDLMWDPLQFYVSFRAYCIDFFKPYHLSVIQLNQLSINTPQGQVYRV